MIEWEAQKAKRIHRERQVRIIREHKEVRYPPGRSESTSRFMESIMKHTTRSDSTTHPHGMTTVFRSKTKDRSDYEFHLDTE